MGYFESDDRFVSRREMTEKRNQNVFDTQDSAHYRYLRRRQGAAGSSDWEQRRVARELSNYDKDGAYVGADEKLRQQELAVLRQQGENAIGVEREKVAGMIGQGSKAAEFNADATNHAADKQAEAALKKAEVDAAIGAAQWGKFDNAGNFTPGSNVEIERAKSSAAIKAAELKAGADKYAADATVDVQTEKNKGIQATVDAERQLESFKHENAKELAEIKATKGVSVNREILNMLMLEQQHIKKTTGKDVSIVDLYNQKFGKDAE